MRSDKPEAKEFQNWVTRVVLPAIRKDGGYIHGEEHVVSGAMTEDELVFKAKEVMKRKDDRPQDFFDRRDRPTCATIPPSEVFLSRIGR
ncbi:hypothetical protein U8C45_16845 [Sinorhizobium meliloti]|nr:hypothetical protein U8C39_16885 [Sinorhizobium meliloti]WQP34159.1 hypothetical protein U8C45_16845 [Sinorhizobium meliloti]